MNKSILSNAVNIETMRNTKQFLLPDLKKAAKRQEYDIYPTFDIAGPIYTGYKALANWIIACNHDIVIDGYSGVYWDVLICNLNDEFAASNIQANWINVNKALKPESIIHEITANYDGGDDPLFGKLYDGELSDFFDVEKLKSLKPEPNKLNILYGAGAALAGWKCTLLYIDVPKNEIQFRSRANTICNLGEKLPSDPKNQYKRFYFIDWPVLNKHKKQLLPAIDVIIDEQRINEISWATGDTLRNGLKTMSSHMFRARPWFEPGVWGGQWIKNNINGLNKDVVNYAWSFELIAPENGILLQSGNNILEVSLDTLLLLDNEAILGKAAARFGDAFPIRFDFLDTFDGGNLSLQCHPSVEYIKNNFGEDFTQDETYYILDAEPGAEVYLGFQENINKQQFRSVLENSFEQNEPVEIKDYVQTFPATRHDLFLIPNGTVHCSGKNNMVLEISATPYIFTFKMYDWLRPDLSGNPRTLNIDRAFENLNFERKGDVVTETLISKQTTLKKGHDWEIINLSTHPEHFYAIERFEFDTEITEDTNNQCHVLSLVEGESIAVITNDREQVIHYAETFIIPAAVKSYTLKNTGKTRVKVVKAFVKDECC
ncbi:mannose-6-phosphate isomerase class I [Mucilaginibacter sp. SG538B]|uniref:class I mannose-6-phosphate isomerase n=1 Tax=unclassified Mucilaginibacter TaxID=2617802 RepID=UPI0017BC0A16|nr:class I mannose-6-phosphate isomerase [Mucilaginibacter sp. SG538B]NVM67229.1 mannose-6-phosphate isomerase class I [Mucilaginibacter sp. SG538B]